MERFASSLILAAASALVACASHLRASSKSTDAGCKGNPALTGQCYVVWGWVGLSADAGLVLELDPGFNVPGHPPIPGHHVTLIVRNAPNSEKDGPPNVGDMIKLPAGVHGRYEVCPVPEVQVLPTQSPGMLNFVCIESGSHLQKSVSP